MRQLSKAELVIQPENSSEFPYMKILEEFVARRSEEEAKRRAEAGAGPNQ